MISVKVGISFTVSRTSTVNLLLAKSERRTYQSYEFGVINSVIDLQKKLNKIKTHKY